MATTYRLSQIDAEQSTCTYEVERRAAIVTGDEVIVKRAEWREDISNDPAWSSDWLRVRAI